MLNLGKPPKINKTKYLEQKYGGKWKYDRAAGWWSDDGRHVARCIICYCEDPCNCPKQYFLYEKGKPAVVVNWL